jgi:hypothetical protein
MSENPRRIYDWWPLTDVEGMRQQDPSFDFGDFTQTETRWIVVTAKRDVEVPREIIRELSDDHGAIFRYQAGENPLQVAQRFAEAVNAAAADIAAKHGAT